MQISDLIRKLNAEYAAHGDIEVIGYTPEPEKDWQVDSVEFNDDGDEPVIMLNLEG